MRYGEKTSTCPGDGFGRMRFKGYFAPTTAGTVYGRPLTSAPAAVRAISDSCQRWLPGTRQSDDRSSLPAIGT